MKVDARYREPDWPQRLRLRLYRLPLTQRAIATRIGHSRRRVIDIMNGSALPKYPVFFVLHALCDEFGIPHP